MTQRAVIRIIHSTRLMGLMHLVISKQQISVR